MSSRESIKDCFRSRFSDGYIVEADFSQLEVIGAAIMSGDKMMKEDILNKVDAHSQSASWLSEFTYKEILDGYNNGDQFFTKLRKESKAPRFQLQYGAGAKGIAEKNEIPLSAAEGFIEKYYARYSGLKQYQDICIESVKAHRKPSGNRLNNGVPLMEGELINPFTKRRLLFEEQESPKWLQDKGVLATISPTQVKNYPSQSFSTGDIVPEVLGKLHRALASSPDLWDNIYMINTIHDSVIFDVRDDNALEACYNVCKAVMESVPELMRLRFGIDISEFPFDINVEYGKKWSEMKSYE